MWAKILEDKVIIYERTDANSAELGSLKKDDEVRLGKTFFKDGDRWNKVYIDNEEAGYAKCVDYFRIRKILIKNDQLYLYDKPSSAGDPKERLYKNIMIYLIKKMSIDSETWYELRDSSGFTYYANHKLVWQEVKSEFLHSRGLYDKKVFRKKNEIKREILIFLFIFLVFSGTYQLLLEELKKTELSPYIFFVGIFIIVLIIILRNPEEFRIKRFEKEGPPKKRD